MTRQTWTAVVSALFFVILAAALAFVPVPYVIYSPGRAYNVLGDNAANQPIIQISGIQSHQTSGQLFMTTVAVTRSSGRVGLGEALVAYWGPARDALPRDAVYTQGKSDEQVRTEEQLLMDTSKQDAVVAALRQADVPVHPMPVVASVSVAGPAHEKLQPGDLIESVNRQPVATPDDVRRIIRAAAPGDEVSLDIVRDRQPLNVRLSSDLSGQSRSAVIGITVDTGYSYEPRIDFGVGRDIGGPSAGLVFALAVYDRITPKDLLNQRSVAGTGTINSDGKVGPIGGIQEKVDGAQAAGAQVFLVPAANCRDLAGVKTTMTLIRVDTLDSAIRSLDALADPAQQGQLPHC
ncbi:YlbL family protein [Granulicoccus phenolivorans]|uniref:YlbL family protein n=1 Tax=Granulicoccus phenolivorans TaxID=266854 RepID=UPI000AD6D051|nr:S16 family serine protease [Granulicoccus phenolivorans]